MSLHGFTIPAQQPEPAQSGLNAFLARGQVVGVQRAFVADGSNSFWTVLVELAPGAAPLPADLRASATAAARPRGGSVDYRQVFNAADFARYAALREQRRLLASSEGVPVYAVFSNEQLADMLRQQVYSRAGLADLYALASGSVGRRQPSAGSLPPMMARRMPAPASRKACRSRAARRRVAQARGQRACGLPQPRPAWQCQAQHGLSSCPELCGPAAPLGPGAWAPGGCRTAAGCASTGDQAGRPDRGGLPGATANRQGPGVLVGRRRCAAGRTLPGLPVGQGPDHVA